MKHPDLDAVIEVPDEAVPVYRQSNWDVLSDQEVVDLLKKRRRESQATEQAMAKAADETLPPEVRTTRADDAAAATDAGNTKKRGNG